MAMPSSLVCLSGTGMLAPVAMNEDTRYSDEPPWARRIHRFWYGEQDVHDQGYQHLFKRWYRGGPDFDREVRDTFEDLLLRVADDRDDLSPWTSTPRARHCAVLLLDQMSRNMYRGSARMFAFDPLAIALVRQALDNGEYDRLAPVERLFMAVALEHSEAFEDVELSHQLMIELARIAPEPQARRFESMVRYNRDHLRVVRRFGRYPHRNRLLGRESTDDEREFLARTSYRWMRSVEPA